MLREATRQLAAWTSADGNDITVAVNVSAARLGHPALIHDVRTVLRDARLDPSRLHIEITETAVVADLRTAIAQVTALRELGVRIAIDDFGIGQSSLSFLHQLPIDIIKMDRTFVSQMTAQPKCASMVRGIIRLAEAIGARTIGEGIESQEQCRALHALDCEFGQGYHLARPAPATDIDFFPAVHQ
jgi:EAL domain-containing protein (putative c-di-GMP-specific phosphodiesterase class I)